LSGQNYLKNPGGSLEVKAKKKVERGNARETGRGLWVHVEDLGSFPAIRKTEPGDGDRSKGVRGISTQRQRGTWRVSHKLDRLEGRSGEEKTKIVCEFDMLC